MYFASTSETVNTTIGVSSVTEDTVFRVGSVSKLFTVTLLLIEEGLWAFSEPIAKYVPELREAAEKLQWDPRNRRDTIDYVDWGAITIGELASHMAGIPRDCVYFHLVLFRASSLHVFLTLIPFLFSAVQ